MIEYWFWKFGMKEWLMKVKVYEFGFKEYLYLRERGSNV